MTAASKLKKVVIIEDDIDPYFEFLFSEWLTQYYKYRGEFIENSKTNPTF